MGGLELTQQGAEVALEQKLAELGCSLTAPMQLATLDQRISAAKAIIQTGVGFKTDHTSDDEPLRRAVVIFPEWNDQKPLNPPAAKGALTSGESKKARGNGGRGKKRTAAKPRRKSGGNGK